MLYFKARIFLFLLAGIILFSCNTRKKNDVINEGIIKYEISYLEDEDSNPLVSILPTTLELKFKNNKSVTKVVGWLGLFSSIYITDADLGLNFTLLKLMNKKYSYKSLINDPIPGYDTPHNFNVEFTNERKTILGYHCKKAILTIPGNEWSPLEIYYNDKFSVNNYFLDNLYQKKIPGFLFEFPIKLNGIEMHLRIKSIVPCTIPENEFEIPEDYMDVSKETMQEIIESII